MPYICNLLLHLKESSGHPIVETSGPASEMAGQDSIQMIVQGAWMISNKYWIKSWLLNNGYNVSQCLTWSSDYDYDGIARGFCMTKFVGPIMAIIFSKPKLVQNINLTHDLIILTCTK